MDATPDMQSLLAAYRTRAGEADCELLEPLGGPRLRLRFIGPLHGRPVLWDAAFTTLAEAGLSRNTIEVGPEGAAGRRLTVALRVARFDAATVEKAVLMVRRWKGLREGRHSYGPATDAALPNGADRD